MEKFLKKVIIFSNLNEDNYNAIISISKMKKYKKKEIIFEDGDKVKGFYIVYNGKVKIYKISFEGKEHILHIFSKYQIFGEVPVFAGGVYPASAMAIENSEILFIEKENFINLINNNPKIALNMLSVLSVRLHAFTNIIEALSLKEVPARLATYLLILYEKEKSNIFDLDVTKNQLASILGTIPETLSRIFNKLAQNNFINIKGKTIEIKDLEKITALSNGFEKI